jgi:hypothetical protein
MSQENVEAFKRGTEAYNRRDVDALLKELEPEVEWHSALLIPFGGEATVSRGHDGVREVLGDLHEASPRSTSTTRRSGTWGIESSGSAASAPGASKAAW